MVPDRRISLFTVLAIVLAGGIAVTMYWPYRVGLQIARNERIAIRALAAIHAVNRRPEAPPPGWRYRFLQELEADPSVGDGLVERLGRAYAGDDLRVAGYRFRIYLPDREGQGVSYSRVGRVSATRASAAYACYAWPADYGRTGRRAFVVDAAGEIHATENQHRRYGDDGREPAPGAGFTVDDLQRLATGPRRDAADDRHWGADGQLWRLTDRPEAETTASTGAKPTLASTR